MKTSTKRVSLLATLSVAVILCAGSLTGCSHMIQGALQAPKDAEALDASVHAAMGRGDWQSVYANADPELRSSATEAKFGALFTAISTKLGQPVSSTQTSWRINATTSGTYLYSDCATKFSRNATATESFVWKKDGGNYHLAGYHINSDELITR